MSAPDPDLHRPAPQVPEPGAARVRRRRRLRGILRLYRHIPTALTIGNSLCGFGAILLVLQIYDDTVTDHIGVLSAACWLIVGAMIFDMLDGWAARLLNAYSLHGMHMDSLADMCTFGVAPAVLVAVMAHGAVLNWLPYQVVWVFCAIYLACAALRLALYNVKATEKNMRDHGLPPDFEDSTPPEGLEETDDSAFHGLPSPGAAAGVCSVIILLGEQVPVSEGGDAATVGPTYLDWEYVLLAQLLPIYAAFLGFLMVSSIPYMHFGRFLGSRRFYKLKLLGVIFVAFLAIATSYRLVAAVLINAYILSGPIKALIAWIRQAGSGPTPVDESGAA